MERSKMEENIRIVYDCAMDFVKTRYYNRALALTNEGIMVHGNDRSCAILCFLQGLAFSKLSEKAEEDDVKYTYLLSSLDMSYRSTFLRPASLRFSHTYAHSLFQVAEQLQSSAFYKKTKTEAVRGLSLETPEEILERDITLPYDTREGLKPRKRVWDMRYELRTLIACVEDKMRPGAGKVVVDYSIEAKENNSKSRLARDVQKGAGMRKDDTFVAAERLRSFWGQMSVESKRKFLIVDVEKLKRYVEAEYGSRGQDALEKSLSFAQTKRRWRIWRCGSCLQEFLRRAECKKHIEQEHVEAARPLKDIVPSVLDDCWAEMIYSEDWEPVDVPAAVRMINHRLARGESFDPAGRWLKDWPIDNRDKRRRKIFKELGQLLKSLFEQKIFPCSLMEWLLEFAIEHLDLRGVHEDFPVHSVLCATPHCFRFLGADRLEEAQGYLTDKIRDINTDMISKAVAGFSKDYRVKERIYFCKDFSHLLLDKRLLKGKFDAVEDEGTVEVCSDSYFSGVSPQGDEIISWFLDCRMLNGKALLRNPVGVHDYDIWLAVSRVVERRCRALVRRYQKKKTLLLYPDVLSEVQMLCADEELRKDRRNASASILLSKCQERVRIDGTDSFDTLLFLSVVRDVLEGAEFPTLTIIEAEELLKSISEHSNVDDDSVIDNSLVLKVAVSNKFHLMDLKILLHENSMNQLLGDLQTLATFDYRLVILPMLKCFLRNQLEDMMAVAAGAALLSSIIKEKENQPPLPPTKRKNRKRPGRGFKNKPIDPSVRNGDDPLDDSGSNHGLMKAEVGENLEHVSGKENGNVGEVSYPGDELSGTSELSGTKETQTMSERVPLENERVLELKHGFELIETESSAQLISAAEEDDVTYDSVLDMILKSLWHIKLFRKELARCRPLLHDHRTDKCAVCALQNLLSLFVAQESCEEELYRYLLHELLVALRVARRSEEHAAELLVIIFEFLHFWECPFRETIATSLFTVEECEQMNCNRCKWEPKYPKERSYGLVVWADTLREIKSAFPEFTFENILKVIRVRLMMLCDSRTGGCGERNYVDHHLKRFPAVFTIALEWEKNETEEEIYATTAALATEIDIRVLFKGVTLVAEYCLVSMVGSGEEEYNCIAYENERWVRHSPSAKEDIGDWQSVLALCGEKRIRPEILLFEAPWWTEKLRVP